MADRAGAAGFSRVIGTRALALTMVNITVGSGIFGLPGEAAQGLGSAAIFAYLLCAVVMGLIGLCLAEAGSRVTEAGGLYAYADRAFGRYAATFVGLVLFVANGSAANAAVAVLFANTLDLAFPGHFSPVGRIAVVFAYYGFLAVTNMRGVRQGMALSQVTTVIKILPLVALVVLGVPHIAPASLAITALPSVGSLGATSALLFFAFMGIEGGLSASGDVARPERTIPRAIFLALASITLLYIGLQYVAQGVLGPALAQEATAPLAATAGAIFGRGGAQFVLLATLFSSLGYLSGDVATTPRAVEAIAAAGLLPSALARRNPVTGVPAVATLAYIGLAAIFAASGTFKYLVTFSAAGTLAMYLICCLGVLRLRRAGVTGGDAPFVVRGGALVPVLASLGIVGLLASLAWSDLLALGGLIAVALVVARLRPRPAHA